MNDDFWKLFPPIPGFDCVKMKHEIQERIYQQTKHMTLHEFMGYCRGGAGQFPRTGRIPTRGSPSLLVKEEPPYGAQPPRKD